MLSVEYYQLSQKRQGSPFAIISSKDEFFRADELLRPSLRDFHVVLWFREGEGSYFIDFKEYQFQANTITLISKDQLHYLNPPDDSWEILSIAFTAEFLYRNNYDLQHLFNFTIASHIEGQQIIHLPGSYIAPLENICHNMRITDQKWSNPARENAFYHWLCLFLIYCEKLQSKAAYSSAAIADSDTSTLLRFNELLEKHFREARKVNFYAHQLNITMRMLYRLTQKRYKLSPKAVIDQRRILEIKRLLRGTDKPVKEIAYTLGFDEPTNMVKYFRKHTDQTPTSYRSGG